MPALLPTTEKFIRTHTYKVTQLDAITGRKALGRLLRAVAPVISDAQAVAKKNEAGAEGVIIAKVIVEGLTEENIEYFCNLFAQQTCVTGGNYGDKSPPLASVFAVHFVGKYTEMFEWLIFCVQENFGGFFGELGLQKGDAPHAATSSASQ